MHLACSGSTVLLSQPAADPKMRSFLEKGTTATSDPSKGPGSKEFALRFCFVPPGQPPQTRVHRSRTMSLVIYVCYSNQCVSCHSFSSIGPFRAKVRRTFLCFWIERSEDGNRLSSSSWPRRMERGVMQLCLLRRPASATMQASSHAPGQATKKENRMVT